MQTLNQLASITHTCHSIVMVKETTVGYRSFCFQIPDNGGEKRRPTTETGTGYVYIILECLPVLSKTRREVMKGRWKPVFPSPFSIQLMPKAQDMNC